jgi:hypothetical protein
MRDITEEEKQYLNATWKSLPHFGTDENALAVIDTSGSMYWGNPPLPAAVALSLGIYFAEHNYLLLLPLPYINTKGDRGVAFSISSRGKLIKNYFCAKNALISSSSKMFCVWNT